MNSNDVLHFWFQELTPADWWGKSDALDHTVGERFGQALGAAARGELFAWRDDARGRLAEIIVLDQFSRHVYRGQPQSFAQDGMALVLAQEAVCLGADRELAVNERSFLYLPYMHSESHLIQDISIRLFDQPGLEDNLRFAHAHRDIIVRFDRYPHRNAVLGRMSTPEELAFLEQPGSSF